MASLLSKKMRQAAPGAQVASLVRIARRASIKADWLLHGPFDGQDHTAEAAELNRKAQQATDEILAVVRANPDHPHWTLAQRRAAGIA